MYLVAIAWLYVVLMMAIAEATHASGSVLGALFTFLLYGVLPLGVVMYILGTPARRRARLALERSSSVCRDPDGSGHPPAVPETRAISAEREET